LPINLDVSFFLFSNWTSEQLRECLEVYQNTVNREHRQAEVARTHFKLSLIFDKQGKEDEAGLARQRAEEIRKDIMKTNFYPSQGLESYDSLVSHWQL
jgi:hypothetical protein